MCYSLLIFDYIWRSGAQKPWWRNLEMSRK